MSHIPHDMTPLEVAKMAVHYSQQGDEEKFNEWGTEAFRRIEDEKERRGVYRPGCNTDHIQVDSGLLVKSNGAGE